MLKKFYAAVCVLIAAALTGCSGKGNNSSEKAEEEAVVSPRTITFEWQEAYSAKLDEFRASGEYQESNGVTGSMFDLRDLNADGVPELIISPSTDTDDDVKCVVYTYSGGQTVEIGENGSNGFFSYYPGSGVIVDEFQGSGFVVGEFRRIAGTSFQTEMTYYNNMDSVESGAVIRYEIDREEVLAADYNQKIYSYTEQPFVTVGRRFTFGDNVREQAIYCSEGWMKASSAGMKKLFRDKINELSGDYPDAAFDFVDMNGDECPELIFSEGTAVEDACRIFVYNSGELVECSEKCGANGRFGFDVDNLVFFTINPQKVDQFGSFTDISLDGYQKSGDIMECGRKYIVSDEVISAVFD